VDSQCFASGPSILYAPSRTKRTLRQAPSSPATTGSAMTQAASRVMATWRKAVVAKRKKAGSAGFL
jgi:hypothetical protein